MPVDKFYFPRSEGSAPAVVPAADAFWNAAGILSPSTLALSPTRISDTDNLGITLGAPLGGAIRNALAATYVLPLSAGEVEGDFRCVFACNATSTGNAVSQLRIRVVQADGSARGLLYAGTSISTTPLPTDPADPDFKVVGNTANTPGSVSRLRSGSFTPVTASAGDCLVVELGIRMLTPNSTNRYCGVVTGTDTEVSDHTYVVDEAPGVGWFEWTTPDPAPGFYLGSDQVSLYKGTDAVSAAYLG